MKRWLWPVLAAVIVTSCDDWPAWDRVFDRSSLGANGKGWTGGDGAINTMLPGSNRALWIFGDSYLSGGIDANRQRTNLGLPTFGTTIGEQTSTDAPAANKIQFYARQRSASCTSVVDGSKPACSIVPVTSDATAADGYAAVFDHKAFGLSALPNEAPAVLWPLGATCLDCRNASTADDKVIVSLTEAAGCNPQIQTPCIPLCEDGPADCTAGVRLLRNVIGRVVNAASSPQLWSIATGPAVIHTDVYWGTSFVQEDGVVYIYGVDKATQSKLLVARAAVADVLDPIKWQYRASSQWRTFSTLPNLSQLQVAASGVSALPTVTKVTRNGTSAYVLVHDHTVGDHFLYVRTSTVRSSFTAIGAATPKIDLAAGDTSLQWLQVLRFLNGTCTANVHNGEHDFRACGQSYHGKATPDISPGASTGDFQYLYYSYVVPFDAAGTQNDARYYVPKFGFIPIDLLSPWCSGSACWTGIAREFARVSIAANEDRRYAFDVTQSTKLRVELTGGTGNPNLFVRFDSPAAGGSGDACARTANSFPESCDLTMSGKTTAHVLVRGASAGSYTLRVVYDGQ